jgi:hypothetical protein
MIKERDKEPSDWKQRWIEASNVTKQIHNGVDLPIILAVFRVVTEKDWNYIAVLSFIGLIVKVTVLDLNELKVRLLAKLDEIVLQLRHGLLIVDISLFPSVGVHLNEESVIDILFNDTNFVEIVSSLNTWIINAQRYYIVITVIKVRVDQSHREGGVFKEIVYFLRRFADYGRTCFIFASVHLQLDVPKFLTVVITLQAEVIFVLHTH